MLPNTNGASRPRQCAAFSWRATAALGIAVVAHTASAMSGTGADLPTRLAPMREGAYADSFWKGDALAEQHADSSTQ